MDRVNTIEATIAGAVRGYEVEAVFARANDSAVKATRSRPRNPDPRPRQGGQP